MTGQRLRENRDISLQATKRRPITVEKVHNPQECEGVNRALSFRRAA